MMTKVKIPLRDRGLTITRNVSIFPLSLVTNAVVPAWLRTVGRPEKPEPMILSVTVLPATAWPITRRATGDTPLGVGVVAPTWRLKRNVPGSPLASLIVPRTTYEPTASVPLVVIRPVGETIMAGVPEVSTYVTAPLLPVTESWSVKVVDVTVVAVAPVGELWVMVPAGPTRRLKKNVPVSPLASLIVPRTTYDPGANVPLVVIRPVGETIMAGAPEIGRAHV